VLDNLVPAFSQWRQVKRILLHKKIHTFEFTRMRKSQKQFCLL